MEFGEFIVYLDVEKIFLMTVSSEFAIIYSVRILKTDVQAKILWHMDFAFAR